MKLTRDDRRFLRDIHVSPHNVCETCQGEKCDDSKQTGVRIIHAPRCQGDGCDCRDTTHAPQNNERENR